MLLRDLLGHPADGRSAEALAVHAGRRDTGQAAGVQLPVHLEEGTQRVAEVPLGTREHHTQLAVFAELAHGHAGGDLAEVDAEEQRTR